jgi:hypothetical protein
MTGNYKYRALWLLCSLLIIACSKDGADGNDLSNPNEGKTEIRIQTNVSSVLEGRRAQTYDNVSNLQTEGSFTCTAYNAGTLTAYIPTTTSDWIAVASRWGFNNGNDHYYWPSTGDLDFFAYAPATPPSYITAGPAYTAAHNVTFTCSDLPMTNAGQDNDLKEFIFGMALGQNYGNASTGVPLQFQHPFARIKLQLPANHRAIHINTITFKSIKNNGSYDTGTWDTSSGGATNFVWSFDADYDNHASDTPLALGDSYLVIPQDWEGEIEVNATWIIWDENNKEFTVSTNLPGTITWLGGYSYTYTFNITETDLIVNTSKFTEQW